MDAVRPKPTAGMGIEVSGDHDRVIDNMQVHNMTAGYGGIENGHGVGVIGESGCGKSTLARVMAGMLPPAKGEIKLDGELLEGDLRDRKLDELQKVQFVFQMADTALNPKQVIGDILGRPLEFYHGLTGKEKHAKVAEILEMVELPAEFASRYPMELSGGQKQRINMARSLAANPEVMLCDEVTSALDSIVGANVIKLLTNLRDKTGVSFVFISHDLSTVASFADEIVVLYAGRVVEQGPTDEVLEPPFHPYTRLLISSVPEMRIGWLEETMKKREMAVGIAKGVEITAVGCPFYNRCPLGIENTCDKLVPPDLRLQNGHVISCHLTLDQLQEAEAHTQQILHGYERIGKDDPALPA
jgi:peptide/nickel transport system ATP-binding protein